jgi:hypothetical protein
MHIMCRILIILRLHSQTYLTIVGEKLDQNYKGTVRSQLFAIVRLISVEMRS